MACISNVWVIQIQCIYEDDEVRSDFFNANIIYQVVSYG
jgi:hypothetical protein